VYLSATPPQFVFILVSHFSCGVRWRKASRMRMATPRRCPRTSHWEPLGGTDGLFLCRDQEKDGFPSPAFKVRVRLVAHCCRDDNELEIAGDVESEKKEQARRWPGRGTQFHTAFCHSEAHPISQILSENFNDDDKWAATYHDNSSKKRMRARRRPKCVSLSCSRRRHPSEYY